MYPASSVAPERLRPGLTRPCSSSSSQTIDLTLEDEDDNEDEPIESHVAQDSVATESATSSDSGAFQVSGLHEMDNKTAGEATLAIRMPVTEDIESDVDEEWPHVPVKTPVLVHHQVSSSQTQEENGRVTLDVISKTIPLSYDDQQESLLKENNKQVKVTRQETSTSSLNDDGYNEMDEDEELPKQVAKTDDGSVSTTDQLVQMESLEDGEILEERVSLKPMMQLNTFKHHKSGNVGRQLVDTTGIRPHQRSKKQKKRGKKKTKRKLEAMQMMHNPPGQMYPGYERTIRPRPLADASSPGHYTHAIMRDGPRGEPMNMRPVFHDAAPAFFRAGDLRVGVPHPPIRPSSQQRPVHSLPSPQRLTRPLPLQQRPAHLLPPQQRPARSLPPPYEDSQILRVNRQGSMEMINGEANLSLRLLTSEPPTFDGFKYQSVSVFPSPPVPNGPGFPLQRSACDSAWLPPVLTSSGGKTTHSVASTGRDEMGDVDLNSLRTAALRTKMKRSLKQMEQTTEIVTATQSSPSTSKSSSKPAHCEEKQTKAMSPEVDKLRFDILRSMTKNRNRTANSKALNVSPPILQVIEPNAIEKSNESGMNKATKSNTSAAQGDPSASKDPSDCTLTHMSARANGIGSDGPSSETNKLTITSEQNKIVSKTAPSQLAMLSEKAKLSSKLAVSTPEFRPLTASSQSLVIQLGPEDFLPQKSKDDATTSSGLQDAIKEMRRKIAEREKEQTNRLLASAANGLLKPLPSPALSSLSLESQVSSVATQSLCATVASPGVSSSDTDSVKESSTGMTRE
ncbi:unnamed protein product [Peronospora destructor]|uniref:Uncharacterized protein n=1 Tax=Peronospora destructor TaxID=86335 RepID=A0AAV0U315_9STRA|nr:unnamed protein product [Peronospora destructor]